MIKSERERESRYERKGVTESVILNRYKEMEYVRKGKRERIKDWASIK